MSNTKHTKGPWHWDNENLLLTSDNEAVLNARTGIEARRSDAHLIAAAPEMLEALECAKIMLNETHAENKDLLNTINQALNKAKGGSQ